MAGSRRERELARQRALRQAQRRAERENRRRRRNAIVASVVAALLVAGAVVGTAVATREGDDDTLAADPTPSASATATASASATPSASADPGAACSYEESGEPARPVEPPGDDVDRETPLAAVISTDRGDIPIELRTADAPCTVHSFAHLAAEGFYSDTPCHRLTDRGIFVLQCGDPSGTGRGGPGYRFDDENLTGATYERGVVAMANSGENTNGSQFFLVYEDSTLPPQYTPFGTISEAGLKVLDTIAAAGAQPPDESGNTAPKLPVQITSVTVRPAS